MKPSGSDHPVSLRAEKIQSALELISSEHACNDEEGGSRLWRLAPAWEPFSSAPEEAQDRPCEMGAAAHDWLSPTPFRVSRL